MTLQQLECRLRGDPSLLAKLIVEPRETLEAAGVQLADASEVKRLEWFLRSVQEQIRVAGQFSGFEPSGIAEWGIGIACCNSKSLVAFDADQLARMDRRESAFEESIRRDR